MILDLDETLIHSFHDGVLRPTVKPGTPPDFILKVTIDRHPVRFFVHKRPHVDFFLNIVSCFWKRKICFFNCSLFILGITMVRAGRIYCLYGDLWYRRCRQAWQWQRTPQEAILSSTLHFGLWILHKGSKCHLFRSRIGIHSG